MVVIGWGLEGVIVGCVMDVMDFDCGVFICYIVEVIYWVVFILLVIVLFVYVFVFVMEIVLGIVYSKVLLWLVVGGVIFLFCVVVWYKLFLLIGVGCG